MKIPTSRQRALLPALVPIVMLLPGSLRHADARETFNLHALELDNPGQQIADLSFFAEPDGQLPGTYRVTVYVNGEKQGEAQDIAFVAGAENRLHALLTPAMLRRWGVKIDAFPGLAALSPETPLEDIGHYIPMATAELQFSQLRLNVSLPQAAMDARARGEVDPAEWDEGVTAALLNYSLSGSHRWLDVGKGSRDSYYASLQSGINLGAWRLRNDSTGYYASGHASRWTSINTYLQRNIKGLKGQLTLGDSYTTSEIFDSVQFRGAQLASDDNMLPDSLRGFAPVIRGIAHSSAQVTIRQSDYIIYQSYVAPGAFIIRDLYPTSGSGDLTVTIKEADGSERTFVQPFSAVPIMQREGHLKYALTAGKYRSGNRTRDEPAFGQATAIYGLPRGITLFGGAIAAQHYHAGAAGLGFGLGDPGSLSADMSVARSTLDRNDTHHGHSYRLQYAKDFQATDTRFTLAAYRYSTAGFYTFQEANDRRGGGYQYWRGVNNKRQKLQLELSQSMGDYGSLYLSGFQQSFWQEAGFERTLSTGWSGNFSGISYNLAYSYNTYPARAQPAEQQLAFSIQVPLSRFLPNAWASYSLNSAKHGPTRQQVGLSGTTLADNNLSYSIQQSHSNHGAGSAGSLSAAYKGGQGEVNGGYNYDAHYQQINYGLKGGVVAHPHGVTLSQPLGQALAVLKAPGARDAKVQNNTGLYTDRRGYAVVPYVTPYRKNRLVLDTTTLGDEVDIDSAVQTVTPTNGAVVMANVNTRVGRRVLMKLFYQGRPVPFGAQATLAEGGSGIVGDDGQVYLAGVADEGKIKVKWNADQQCVVHFRLPDNVGNSPVIETEQECLA
ncbi:fimbrial biogenesis outer membrane usher protein [Kosakonia cowanii]|uniref:fimbria/pilus outer membrane usher protein n=1 Tax=Kosakonia cowanii TaxID=208223 RepID=UPI0023F62390|nr:fimbria/pilus outer membrane usher protein [Kosakonia cowanii]MDF7761440.1 fimbrial biogenesis outer membrane usher protein [Kosakonia cowanii]